MDVMDDTACSPDYNPGISSNLWSILVSRIYDKFKLPFNCWIKGSYSKCLGQFGTKHFENVCWHHIR